MALTPQAALRRRALQWLAQREHSRQELRAKLERWWRAQTLAENAAAAASVDAPLGDLPSDLPGNVPGNLLDGLLDALQAQGHLSESRLTEGRIHMRQERFGNRRIEHELRSLGVQMSPAQQDALALGEAQRARRVRARRFGEQLPPTAAEKARQMRFLASRGFTGSAIQQALSEPEDEPAADGRS